MGGVRFHKPISTTFTIIILAVQAQTVRRHGAIAEKPQARQVRLADAQELKALVFEPGCTLEGPLLIVLADDSETDPLELSWSPWPRVV